MAVSSREALVVHALRYGLEFDPKQISNTTLRSEIARVEIPQLVGKLIQKLEEGGELTERDKDSLFKAYQRYYQAKSPFKHPLPTSYGEAWDRKLNKERNIKNLIDLADPTVHSKQIVYLLIQGLWPVRSH